MFEWEKLAPDRKLFNNIKIFINVGEKLNRLGFKVGIYLTVMSILLASLPVRAEESCEDIFPKKYTDMSKIIGRLLRGSDEGRILLLKVVMLIILVYLLCCIVHMAAFAYAFRHAWPL